MSTALSPRTLFPVCNTLAEAEAAIAQALPQVPRNLLHSCLMLYHNTLLRLWQAQNQE